MKCPYCQAADSKVIETREIASSGEIRRRRECLSCVRRFTTREKAEIVVKSIVKGDGRREDFNPEKIRKGVKRACEKRPVPSLVIDEIVARIEQEVNLFPNKEIESRLVGEMVMIELKKLDEVAYIRFASVYKNFKDAAEFSAEIARITGGKEMST